MTRLFPVPVTALVWIAAAFRRRGVFRKLRLGEIGVDRDWRRFGDPAVGLVRQSSFLMWHGHGHCWKAGTAASERSTFAPKLPRYAPDPSSLHREAILSRWSTHPGRMRRWGNTQIEWQRCGIQGDLRERSQRPMTIHEAINGNQTAFLYSARKRPARIWSFQ